MGTWVGNTLHCLHQRGRGLYLGSREDADFLVVYEMDGLIILFKLQELSCLQLWYMSVD